MNQHTPSRSPIVGIGAIMPDAPDAAAFWANITGGRYSISDVPPERWDPELYYDADPHAPDKTYSRIGGWVREFPWDPIGWRLPVPPKVAAQIDPGQKWAVVGGARGAARRRLARAGASTPSGSRSSSATRIGGEKHYATQPADRATRVRRASSRGADLRGAARRRARRRSWTRPHERSWPGYPEITEDTMPGELANIIAGRVANLFNFRGPELHHRRRLRVGAGRDRSAAVHGLRGAPVRRGRSPAASTATWASPPS